MSALLFVQSKREVRESKKWLSLISLGASGDQKTIQKQQRDWDEEIK